MLTSAKLMRVFVLLFNARTDDEGIHTLRIGQRNIVLMFEEEDDATRFAVLLEAQDFPPVTVEGFEPEEIEEFCREAGYEAKQIPSGKLLMPPEKNAEETDLAAELSGHQPISPESPEAEPTESEPAPATDEYDRIRRQLENLL